MRMDNAPESQLESEDRLQAGSHMVMAMLAMHPRPHRVMRRFRDLLETCRTDPSDDGIIERLQTGIGQVPSTLEQLLHALHGAELMSDADGGQRCYDSERMHDLFLAALLSSHPQPHLIRGQFRTLLAGLTASHARYAFDESFLLSIRRSALRLDRMIELVISAQETAAVTTRGTTSRVNGQALPRVDATSAATAAN
jgi:hypothetical protein